jgi:ABC-type transporter Mla subunit MlaD
MELNAALELVQTQRPQVIFGDELNAFVNDLNAFVNDLNAFVNDLNAFVNDAHAFCKWCTCVS